LAGVRFEVTPFPAELRPSLFPETCCAGSMQVMPLARIAEKGILGRQVRDQTR
jgi:hypothetical protein